MRSTTKNVEAFEKLLGLCTLYSDSYKPGNASIQRMALMLLLEEAKKSIAAVHVAQGELAKVINIREQAFAKLPILGTKVINYAQASGMDPLHVEDLNKIRKKFRGFAFAKSAPKTDGVANETPVRKNRISAYVSQAETLAEMINFLETESSYSPQEPELAIVALKENLVSFHAINQSINDAKAKLVSARIYRSRIIFATTGIHGIGMRVKKYFKAIFGANSDGFKTIGKIRFATR
jgi:hypothetical protein